MMWALVVALTMTGPPKPRVTDPWTGLDKWKHFAASAVIESVGYGIASARQGHSASLRIGGGAVIVVGVGKELYDWRTKGQFSFKDFAWDLLGGAAAAAALHAVR